MTKKHQSNKPHQNKSEEKSIWKKIEHYNGKLIPFCIVALLGIIILEIFIHTENESIKRVIKIADIIIISIFLIDLTFLYIKARKQGHGPLYFIQKHWLDILAVLPFGLVAEGIGKSAVAITAAEQVTLSQGVVHESIEISKAASRTEKIAKVTKTAKIGTRIIRVISKSPQFVRFKRKVIKEFQ